MRQHGRAFGRAIVLDAAAQIHPALRGHLALGLGHADACHSHTTHLHRCHADVDRWRRARRHHAGQACQQAVVRVQTRGRAVVFHSQPQLSAFGISQTHHSLHQFGVGQALAVAFEFDGEGFRRRDRVLHLQKTSKRHLAQVFLQQCLNSGAPPRQIKPETCTVNLWKK